MPGPGRYPLAGMLAGDRCTVGEFSRAALGQHLSKRRGLVFCRRSGGVAVPNAVHDDPEAGRSRVRFTFCKQEDALREAVSRHQPW